ncbi:type II and III secretion system protein [Marinobacterium aestuarii]|uniref:Type II and III secretion system protein n=1 Tax=Marinobacterium aestuarii TaxID=1821621 RepID=A0A1A9F3W7_9GAMM|nr:type II and III secretion system protein family protein [Marinobacterium aestuarii]ANG64541.1 type II and III secretion system protein [Marinobacterium aestuarii]
MPFRSLIVLLVVLCGSWQLQAAEQRLYVGGQKSITLNARIARVAVGEPSIAGVRVLSSRQVLLTGKAVGDTSLLVWLSGRTEPERFDLAVYPAGSETENVQVQTDIKVVEVSRQALQSAGFFFGKNTGNSIYAIGNGGTLSGVESGSGGFTLSSNSGFLSDGSAFGIIAGNASKGLLGTVSALSSNGFAYTLAEPSLVSMSGQPAFFLAGGEFPFPKSSDNGEISVEFKEFGVRLNLTPTVLPGERIMLKVAPEVSELDFTGGLQAAGVSVPALRVRRTDTTIQLGAGESFIISGLVSRNTLKSADRLPLLGDIPILGAFFRSTRLERSDKELLMIVTPHLVRPFARTAELPPLPGEIYRDYQPSFLQQLFIDPAPGTVGAMPSGMGFSAEVRP